MVYCYSGYMNHHRILICQYFDPQIPGKQKWQTPMRSSKMSIFFRFRNPQKKKCGLVGDLHLAMGPYNGTVSYFKGGNSTHCPKMLRQNLRQALETNQNAACERCQPSPAWRKNSAILTFCRHRF